MKLSLQIYEKDHQLIYAHNLEGHTIGDLLEGARKVIATWGDKCPDEQVTSWNGITLTIDRDV